MQHIKNVVHSIELAQGIKIVFREGNGSVIQREFRIEIQGSENAPKEYKSLYYVEKFPIYEKRDIISKWEGGFISNDELKKLLS